MIKSMGTSRGYFMDLQGFGNAQGQNRGSHDGVSGVDWNGDGTQETQWTDLAGNSVSCSAGGAMLAVGAVQRASTTPACGNGLAVGAACDDGNACTTGDVCTVGTVCAGIPVLAPSEVDSGVRVGRSGGSAVISWRVAANATTSDVLRGTIGALSSGPSGGDETCVANNFSGATITDPAVPAVNTGYWYLIRGANTCAGNGSYGSQGIHGVPGAPRSSTTCS